jgi:hypothetical protein
MQAEPQLGGNMILRLCILGQEGYLAFDILENFEGVRMQWTQTAEDYSMRGTYVPTLTPP